MRAYVHIRREGDAIGIVNGINREIEKKPHVKVGWHEAKLAAIAAYNEFGTRRIPERPFFRNAMNRGATSYVEMMVRAAVELYRSGGRNAGLERALNRIGFKAVADVQRSISSNTPPPNAASTIARKGSTKTLIDTGAMRQGVSFELGNGDGA